MRNKTIANSKDGKSRRDGMRNKKHSVDGTLRHGDGNSASNNTETLLPDQTTTKLRKMGRDFTDFEDPLDPKEAMMAARRRIVSSVPSHLPAIVPRKAGVTDGYGRITKLPEIGPEGFAREDITYRSDLHQSKGDLNFSYGCTVLPAESSQPVAYPDLNWKHLEVKLPFTATHAVDSYVHHAVHEDVIAFFSVQDGDNVITQQDGEPMLLDLYMGQKPSSRRQAQRLAIWLSQFIESVSAMPPQQSTNISAPKFGNQAASQDGLPTKNGAKAHASSANPSASAKGDQADMEARRIEKELENHKIQKQKILNTLQYLQASGLLDVTHNDPVKWSSTIQQVGVQCYERGALLTQIWNLYTELMDMKFADMREAVVSAESLRVKNGDLLKHLKGAKQGSSKLQAETDEYISSLKEQVGDLSSRLLGAEVERDAALFDIKKFETDIQMLQKYSGGLVDQMMEKDAIIARLENDNDILATTVSSMSDGHAGMKEIMPEIKKGVNETMAAVDTMVKTTKNVKFANEKDVVRCARDQQVAATKVKHPFAAGGVCLVPAPWDNSFSACNPQVASNKLDGELTRLLAMGDLADKKTGEAEQESESEPDLDLLDPEAEPELEAENNAELRSKDQFKEDVETQTPKEWMPNDSDKHSDSSSSYTEEADFCTTCGAKMDACQNCHVHAKTADDEPKEIVRTVTETIRDTEREAELEAQVKDLKALSNDMKREVAKWQQYAEDVKRAAKNNEPEPAPPAAKQDVIPRLVETPDGTPLEKISSRVTKLHKHVSTDDLQIEPKDKPDMKQIKKLEAEIENLQDQLSKLQDKLQKKMEDSGIIKARKPEVKKPEKPKTAKERPTAKFEEQPKSRSKSVRPGKDEPDQPRPPKTAPAAAEDRKSAKSPVQKPNPGQSQSPDPEHDEDPGAASGDEEPAPRTESPKPKAKPKKRASIRNFPEIEPPAKPAHEEHVDVGPTEYKNKDMLEALENHKSSKPRAAEWLLSFIEKIYKGKYQQDIAKTREAQPLSNLVDYMFQHLQGTYGTRMLVLEYVGHIVATLDKHKHKDSRFQIFDTFLSDTWGTRTLEVFLHCRAMLAEPATMKCVEFPPDYAPKRGSSAWVCTRKALHFGNLLLMDRSPETTNSFNEAVLSRSEESTEEEIYKFFPAGAEAAAGSLDAQLQHEIVNGGAFMKIPLSSFLQELCKEFHRCETMLEMSAPKIFKRYDYNSNGSLEYRELVDVLRHLQNQFGENFMEESAIDMWQKCVNIQIKGDVAKGAPAKHPGDVTHIGITAFSEASVESPLVRRYVRLFMTDPPVSEYDLQILSTQKMLGMVIRRHWKLYGHHIESMLGDTGANQGPLMSLVQRLQREEDGMQKCATYCRILKTMCDSKLEDLQNQCAPEQLVSYNASLEESLQRMAVSLQVLYGKQSIIEDDFTATNGDRMQGVDARERIQRLAFFNAVKFRAQHFAALKIQNHFRARGDARNIAIHRLTANTDVSKRFSSRGSSQPKLFEGEYRELDILQEEDSVEAIAMQAAAEMHPSEPVASE